MKKLNVATKYISRFAGQWVAIDKKHDRIIAVGDRLHDIASLVTGKVGAEKKIPAYSFKVPRKDEGPYVLLM